MKTKSIRMRLARKVKMHANEPVKKLAGGVMRESMTISRANYPAIRRREQLNSILLNHCSSGEIADQLKLTDEALLQRMSEETISCGMNPMIRKKAIWALRYYPTPGTFNVLSDLAQFGEDEYIRAHSLRSLGAMGINVAVPLFIRGLVESSEIVKKAAKDALGSTIEILGKEALVPALRVEKSKGIKETINSIVRAKSKKARTKIVRKPREAQKEMVQRKFFL